MHMYMYKWKLKNVIQYAFQGGHSIKSTIQMGKGPCGSGTKRAERCEFFPPCFWEGDLTSENILYHVKWQSPNGRTSSKWDFKNTFKSVGNV